jgi:hypothetical protein
MLSTTKKEEEKRRRRSVFERVKKSQVGQKWIFLKYNNSPLLLISL